MKPVLIGVALAVLLCSAPAGAQQIMLEDFEDGSSAVFSAGEGTGFSISGGNPIEPIDGDFSGIGTGDGTIGTGTQVIAKFVFFVFVSPGTYDLTVTVRLLAPAPPSSDSTVTVDANGVSAEHVFPSSDFTMVGSEFAPPPVDLTVPSVDASAGSITGSVTTAADAGVETMIDDLRAAPSDPLVTFRLSVGRVLTDFYKAMAELRASMSASYEGVTDNRVATNQVRRSIVDAVDSQSALFSAVIDSAQRNATLQIGQPSPEVNHLAAVAAANIRAYAAAFRTLNTQLAQQAASGAQDQEQWRITPTDVEIPDPSGPRVPATVEVIRVRMPQPAVPPDRVRQQWMTQHGHVLLGMQEKPRHPNVERAINGGHGSIQFFDAPYQGVEVISGRSFFGYGKVIELGQPANHKDVFVQVADVEIDISAIPGIEIPFDGFAIDGPTGPNDPRYVTSPGITYGAGGGGGAAGTVLVDTPGFLDPWNIPGVDANAEIVVRNRFRTWIIHISPAPRGVVGYVEWGYNMTVTINAADNGATAAINPVPGFPILRYENAMPADVWTAASENLTIELAPYGGIAGIPN